MAQLFYSLWFVSLLTLLSQAVSAKAAAGDADETVILRSGQCEVEVPVLNKAVVSELKETCETEIEGIFKTFGGNAALPKIPIPVRIVRSPDQIADVSPPDAAPPPWAEAVAFPEHNLIVLSLRNHIGAPIDNLVEVMKHELSHLALRQALKGRPVPRWFSEGIAIHQSEESAVARHLLVWRAALGNRLLPLNGIDQYPERAGDVNLAYAEAADFISWMLKQEGRFGLRSVIRKVADGIPFDKAVKEVFGQSLRSMERDWRNTQIGRWRWISILASEHAVWAGIVVLFITAYLVTRRRKKRKLLAMQKEEEAVDRVLATLETLASTKLPAGPKSTSLERIPTKIRIDDDIHTLH